MVILVLSVASHMDYESDTLDELTIQISNLTEGYGGTATVPLRNQYARRASLASEIANTNAPGNGIRWATPTNKYGTRIYHGPRDWSQQHRNL